MSGLEEEEIFGGQRASDDEQVSEEEEEEDAEELELEDEEILAEEESFEESRKKRRKTLKNAFIDDEAELSGDDVGSGDEVDDSDEDEPDLDLVDKEAPELDSDQEEEVRGLYHRQLESDDKRAVLLMKEHLEDNEIAIGQRRRRKFRWQTRELMENSLRRHYEPDDDEDEDDADDDLEDYGELRPRLSRMAVKPLCALAKYSRAAMDDLSPLNSLDSSDLPGPSAGRQGRANDSGPNELGDNSNSNAVSQTISRTKATSDINKFVFRDKELVEALSTKEVVVVSREEKERVVQREIRRVLQSKSIFDQLYS